MNGLDLERLLRLLRSDPAFWYSTAGALGLVALIVWAGHNRRRMLQRCLILSLGLHAGVAVYGGPHALRWLSDPSLPRGEAAGAADAPRRLDSRVQLLAEPDAPDVAERRGPRGRGSVLASALNALPDLPAPETIPAPRALAPEVAPDRALPDAPGLLPIEADAPLPVDSAPVDRPATILTDGSIAPDPPAPRTTLTPAASDLLALPEPIPARSRRIPDPTLLAEPPPTPVSVVAGVQAATMAPPLAVGPLATAPDRAEILLGPIDPEAPEPASPRPIASALATDLEAVPDPALRPRAPLPAPSLALAVSRPRVELDLPAPPAVPLEPPGLPDATPLRGERSLPDIPQIYRSRFAPNRSALALAAGATPSSEEAVERALAWLARHQDADGRWNAGVRPGPGGRPGPGETSFLAHCPPGDPCSGTSEYWGADNAMTGLALLAFLGAGQTHLGPYTYAPNVKKGLDFLLSVQGDDGDLRGPSRGYGIYCHAIASLALTEAYALTGEERLRGPAQRALDFLIRARAADRLSWRYEPGDRYGGDTSILGWGVMVAKSAREAGLNVPDDLRRGSLGWLAKVASGDARGLAMYRPPGYSDGGRVTPTMTAEAWACRQFLGVGGPSPASDEAASYLLAHGPDRDPFNLYYWYYATLAFYQHGGPSWARWNDRVRDQLVGRQVRGGHADGSWDPALCRDPYDSKGGRVYATALATLTLEVYYRYLKLYDAPASSTEPPSADSLGRSTSLPADPSR
jgi:hypothetical protein